MGAICVFWGGEELGFPALLMGGTRKREKQNFRQKTLPPPAVPETCQEGCLRARLHRGNSPFSASVRIQAVLSESRHALSRRSSRSSLRCHARKHGSASGAPLEAWKWPVTFLGRTSLCCLISN